MREALHRLFTDSDRVGSIERPPLPTPPEPNDGTGVGPICCESGRARVVHRLSPKRPYLLSLLTGLPSALFLARGARRVFVISVYLMIGFAVLWLYALAILCGRSRDVSLNRNPGGARVQAGVQSDNGLGRHLPPEAALVRDPVTDCTFPPGGTRRDRGFRRGVS